MKHVVIVDSMSNIPAQVLKSREHIKVLPLNTEIAGKNGLDLLEAEQLIEFYSQDLLKEDSKANATSPTSEQMSVFLLNEIVPHYDFAIFQSTSAALSDVFKLSMTALKRLKMIRVLSGIWLALMNHLN